jgi:hypothetical protein
VSKPSFITVNFMTGSFHRWVLTIGRVKYAKN